MFLVGLVFLNLFIAVILQEFETSEVIESGRLTGSQFDEFALHWSTFDPDGTGFLPCDLVDTFVRTLAPPLGAKGLPEEVFDKIKLHIALRELNVFETN